MRRAFERLHKTSHGRELAERHPNIRPEWVMRIIANPHDRWERTGGDGIRRTFLAGAVRESNSWIEVIFLGDPETGRFETAFSNRNLARQTHYGRRPEPWEKQ